VYMAKKAPNVTPLEFLEMVATGNNPYWDDTDQNAKKWVFPGRPDLEEAANTRTRNLDADGEEDFEQASDLMDEELPRVTISNITESKVGTYQDNASDLGAETLAETSVATQETGSEDVPPSGDNYDDLPF